MWRRFDRARAACDRLIYAEIARRRRNPGLEQADDVVALLLRARTEDGEALDDALVRDQLITLVVGGHETPASTLAWAFERLVRHPHAMARLTEEAREGSTHDYAEAVIQETLRLRPPIVFVARRVKAPFELAGHLLPEDTLVIPYFPLIHRRPELYPQPLAFQPERFEGVRPPRYGWVPFGGGAHACLGGQFAYLELETVLHALTRRGTFAAPRRRDEPMRRKTITIVPARGGEVVLTERRAA
jgi:cytochrome P450